jgi:MFS transporter, PAT family, beta-lactamase induction signal transducer AmpG
VKRNRVLGALSLLYATQGIPFGLAAEYLPVVLRQSGASLAMIAAVGWLQLPWQLKILWAGAADRPSARTHARTILLVLQLTLALVVASYAIAPFRSARTMWFAITALAALFAATQDVFVDATAVRVLRPEDRGIGNVAQVAGYRMGILIGGAGLLIVMSDLGERPALLLCASLIAVAGAAAFALREEHERADGEAQHARLAARAMIAHVLGRNTWPVIALASTYKLGLHVASILIKPMVVDAKWTTREIGVAVVTAGTVSALVGAGAGGVLHKKLGDARGLFVAGAIQAAACLPLIAAATLHAPRPLTIAAIAAEHFASGIGTTVLFAALMAATRPANAGLHYTVLTSANALSIGLGGVVGGKLGDRLGYPTTYALAAILCLAPLWLLSRWKTAVTASSA